MYRITVLAYPHSLGAELFGFCDLLLIANHVSASLGVNHSPFNVRVAGVAGRSVLLAGGTRIGLQRPHLKPDLLVVPGFEFSDLDTLRKNVDGFGRQVKFIASALRRGTPIASICVGSFLLGAAGALDGRCATTSWLFAEELLRRHPLIDLQPDAMFVEDGGVITTGSFSSAFDLALRLIRRVSGEKIARITSKIALHDPHRQSQAPFVDRAMLDRSTGTFSDNVKQWLRQRISAPYELNKLAQAFKVSSRTMLRRFGSEAGEPPLTYLQGLRVEAAKELLTTTKLSVSEITERTGYEDVSTFIRMFGRRAGSSPAKYRHRFSDK